MNLQTEEDQTQGDWVDAFLRGEGGNVQLADGLLCQPRWWLGPLSVRVQGLTRCCGPEEEMEFRQDPGHWHAHVQAMMESLEAGWQPPPLIVEFRGGTLSVRDGNDRLVALSASGFSKASAFLWFNSQADQKCFHSLILPTLIDSAFQPR